MNKPKDPKDRVLSLVNDLIGELSEPDARAKALELKAIIQLPMKDVLAQVPGDNIAQKARTLGISRPALYGWKRGRRPRPVEAKKLAEFVKRPWQEIAGLAS